VIPITDYVPRPGPFASRLDLIPQVDEVFDQLSEASCEANAGMDTLEILDSSPARYSRQANYFWSRELLGWQDRDAGSTGPATLQAAAMRGVCLESLAPYSPADVAVRPSAEAEADAAMRKVTRIERLTSFEHVRSALTEGLPVMFGMPISQEFYGVTGTFAEQFASYLRDGFPFCASGSKLAAGNHAMVLIGYDDRFDAALVQNSWGSGWGDGGFCVVPWLDLWRSAFDFLVVREFNGQTFGLPPVQDQYAIDLTAIFMATVGRSPARWEIDAWRATGGSMNVIRWSLTTTPEFKARLRLFFPEFYALVYGGADPMNTGPTPRGPNDY
jgi:hypothetical protein